MKYDVAVIGAGPAGSFAAKKLVNLGIRDRAYQNKIKDKVKWQNISYFPVLTMHYFRIIQQPASQDNLTLPV